MRTQCATSCACVCHAIWHACQQPLCDTPSHTSPGTSWADLVGRRPSIALSDRPFLTPAGRTAPRGTVLRQAYCLVPSMLPVHACLRVWLPVQRHRAPLPTDTPTPTPAATQQANKTP